MKNLAVNTKTLLNTLGLRKNKVFAIGFNKTATSSLHALFNEIGRPSYHGVRWRNLLDVRLLNKYDCFSDGIPDDLAKLDAMFPGSKFILQVRDLRSWVHSRLGHIDRYKSTAPYNIGLDWDVTETAIKIWIVQRNAYHKLVLEHFKDRPNDLLIVNFIRDNEAAFKVCRFLNHNHHGKRPRKNVNPIRQLNDKYETMLNNCITELGIPKSELDNDIFCPSLEKSVADLPADSRELTASPVGMSGQD